MTRIHPHADATYRIISLDDGAFGVSVMIPDMAPTEVTSFATEAEARTWITEHKARVEAAASAPARRFRRSGSPR
jgi:hypothetical protein